MKIRHGISVGLFLLAGLAAARTIHVPVEAPTIQAGLDSLHSGDTVRVARGRYEELLTAPTFSFVMIGDFAPDSGEAARPFVYGVNVAGADTLPVFLLPLLSSAVIENMKFQNGPVSPAPLWHRRGLDSWADAVTLRNCVIDSTAWSLYQENWPIGIFTLDSCQFRGCFYVGVNVGKIHSVSCLFTGQSTSGLPVVSAGDSSTIDQCVFREIQPGASLNIYGRGTQILNCTFGPSGPTLTPYLDSPIVEAHGISGEMIGNVFQDCLYGDAVFDISSNNSLTIRDNTFVRCRGVGLQPLGVILIQSNSNNLTDISNNAFVDCIGAAYRDFPLANDTYVFGGQVTITDNHFGVDSANGVPAVNVDPTLNPRVNVILRNNIFEHTGFAARGPEVLDARENWWGDPSGPYHQLRNPFGEGDTVLGELLFDPWNRDTSIFSAAPERKPVLPGGLRLEAYPNPFNAITVISFSLATECRVRLDVFDVAGRRTAELLSATRRTLQTGEHGVTFDGSKLASGIYFLRLQSGEGTITKKVVLLK